MSLHVDCSISEFAAFCSHSVWRNSEKKDFAIIVIVETSSLSCLPDPHVKGRRRSSVFEHRHVPYKKTLSDKVEDRNSVAAIFVLSSRLYLLHVKFIRCQHTPRKNLFTLTLYSMQGKIIRYFGNNCKYVRT